MSSPLERFFRLLFFSDERTTVFSLPLLPAPFRSLSEGTPSAVKAGALPLHSVSMKFNWSDGDK